MVRAKKKVKDRKRTERQKLAEKRSGQMALLARKKATATETPATLSEPEKGQAPE